MLLPYQDKILSRTEIVERAQEWRENGLEVVFTNGCFDILHVGHIQTLHRAKEQGDRLIVGLNADTSVARLKGPSRPVNGQNDRATLLAALACVDAVTVFDEATPVELLEKLRPNIHVKGGDYRAEDLPEAPTVKKYGGRIVVIDLVAGRSTTSIIEKSQKA